MGIEQASVICPHCGENTLVIAKPYRCNMTFTVEFDDENHCAGIDWSSCDGEGDFQYICEYCEEPICADLDQFAELVEDGTLKLTT